jgi:hypothetical protein
VVLTE